MKMPDEICDAEGEAGVPEWFTEILKLQEDALFFEAVDVEQEAVATPEFLQRCRESAMAVFMISKLRAEHQRIGFMPVTLTEYIQGLAKIAAVSLSSLLSWMGVSDLSCSTPDNAGALGRLAHQLGMGIRETLINIRIDFAGRQDAAPVSLLVAHRGGARIKRNQLQECEDVLDEIEAEYSQSDLVDLRRIESEVSRAYISHQS